MDKPIVATNLNTMLVFLMVLIGFPLLSLSVKSEELPCHVLDSVDITDGIRQPDGSILFGDVMYPKNQYATVDYIVEEGVKKFDDFSHIRGCACNIKPCIRLCCPFGTYRIVENETTCLPHPNAQNLDAVVLNENNEKQILNLGHHFAWIVDGDPCKKMYSSDDFQITYNGQILHKNRYLTHHEYCLYTNYRVEPLEKLVDFGNDTSLFGDLENITSSLVDETRFEILVCYNETPSIVFPQYTPFQFDGFLILSAFFILITLLIYACLPKLHSLQGKCMMCYLITLAFGYSLLGYLVINGYEYIKPNSCRLIGFLVLISLLASFLWLNVLNFNLWLNVYPTERFKYWTETEKLQLYALYGFGGSYMWTLFVYLLATIDSLPWFLRPGVGENNCFLNNMFLYFYFPTGITFVINIILFVSICMTKRQANVMQEPNLPADENKMKEKIPVKHFLRLTLILGIFWIVEVIWFLFASNSFAVLILCNTLQGVIIFIIFVLNRHVLRLIKERWQEYRGKTNPNITNASTDQPSEINLS